MALSPPDSVRTIDCMQLKFCTRAVLSKCSYVTIWRAVAGGKLEATAIGNQPRIIGVKLAKWIEAGGVAGRSKAMM